MNTASMPISIDLSWLEKTRLIRPQIKELSIHSHIKSMELPDDSLMPPQITPALNSKSIKSFLFTHPVVISTDKSRNRQIISGIYKFHLARHFLEPNDRIPAMAVHSPTNEQIDQLILDEFLISPIVLKQNLQAENIWKYKVKLENLGILQANNLEKTSKAKWASWLNCGVRKLYD